jgi:hypothetical protein
MQRSDRPWVALIFATIYRFTAGHIHFCQYVLQRPDVERLVGDNRFEPLVLVFALAQPPQLR